MSTEHTCYSRGNILAKLMIVGQSPGKDEATRIWDDPKTKRAVRIPVPFCGVAGILLMSVLRSVGIEEGDYIMSNAVKFYPTADDGGLRAPTLDEIEASRDDLIREIMVLKPKLIIAFGVEAMWSLVYFGKQPLSTVKSLAQHGRVAEITYEMDGQTHTVSVVMMFHPSYVRRQEVSGDREFTKTMSSFVEAFITHKELIEDAIGRTLLLDK